MEIYVKKISYFHINLYFLVFKHDFIRCVNIARIARIAASNTASDDVTNQVTVTHRILHTDLLHSFAHFVVKIYEKCSLNDGF